MILVSNLISVNYAKETRDSKSFIEFKQFNSHDLDATNNLYQISTKSGLPKNLFLFDLNLKLTNWIMISEANHILL